jgi:hypothetical protein
MEADTQNKILYARLDEAVRVTLEKCIKEQRVSKDYFDSIYKQLYEEAWKNFEFIKSKA